ncbi:CPBP family intramembrane metalloprotease [Neolewinella aurantiaca]|uniref:CPBP family intramembrane metalloprotease n=1 Tax=Neolewinella aurantiaca TaxID=2602767 RepID=A0A5C7FMR9_9BACT|nr:type II CAAX endopeptidase family protein [Neolewinella aurantiaca]TXF91432.1 CPBP family intramembrane metalloprotease [Neolewinella aurantiaca]
MRDPKFPDWNHIVILALIFIGGSILGAIPLIIDTMASGVNMEDLAQGLDMSASMSRWAFIASGTPLVLCILYAWKKMGKPRWSLGFENVTVVTALLSIFGTLLVSNGVSATAEYLPGYEGFAEMMEDMMVPGIGIALAVVVVAPIFEEVLLRGLIMRGYLRKTTPFKSILFSGLIFGVMHIYPVHVFFASIMGFCLGYVYYRTRSLGLVILIHFINNAISYYYGMQADAPESSEELLGTGPLGVLGMAAVLTLAGVGLLWFLARNYPLAPPPPEDLEPKDAPALAEL